MVYVLIMTRAKIFNVLITLNAVSNDRLIRCFHQNILSIKAMCEIENLYEIMLISVSKRLKGSLYIILSIYAYLYFCSDIYNSWSCGGMSYYSHNYWSGLCRG